MLISILSAFFFTEIRDLAFNARSREHHMADILNKWELPILILLSLFFQFALAIMGTTKGWKYRATTLASLTLTLADWVVNVALAVLFKKETKNHSREIIMLWTPFLLLHLGGPDPIITNFPPDSALWKYLLSLFIQVGVAVYVYARFQTNSSLIYVSIPIFITGIIKYGQRIWALREASRMQFSNSSFFKAKASAFTADQSTQNEEPIKSFKEFLDSENGIEEGKYIQEAFHLFMMFKPLFLGHKLKFPSALREIFMPSLGSAKDAFRVVEFELDFLYDMIYYKKTMFRPQLFRGICSWSTFAALIAFSIIVGKSAYSKVDIAITYMLLGGEIFLTIYTASLEGLSKWEMLLPSVPKWIYHKVVDMDKVHKQLLRHKAKKKQGIAYLGQHSLIDYCLQTRISKLTTIVRFFRIGDILEKLWLWLTSWKEVDHDLRNFIHCHLLKKQEEYSSSEFRYEVLSNLLSKRGDEVLKRNNMDEISWSINEVGFDHCLLIWHIATYLLFHLDHGRYSAAELGSQCQISKQLSDYMMYLLLLCPNMLPKGMGELRMQETQKEVIGLFINTPLNSTEVVNALFGLNFELAAVLPQSIGKSKSVVAEGCHLASMLRELDELCLWDHNAKWEMIADVWMEMLAFAASRCEWREHAIQLKHGGELLTHVALLMTHLGLTERIEIVKDYSRHLQSVHFDSTRLGWDWKELSQLPYYLA